MDFTYLVKKKQYDGQKNREGKPEISPPKEHHLNGFQEKWKNGGRMIIN